MWTAKSGSSASMNSSSISTNSIQWTTETKDAEDVFDGAVLQYFRNETSPNAVMKCTIRRSESNPENFAIDVEIKNVNEKQKRQMIVANFFDHCDCLPQLVELRRQKRATKASKEVSMNYGAEASFQRPNLEKHVKHVRSRKSLRSLTPSSFKSSRKSTTKTSTK